MDEKIKITKKAREMALEITPDNEDDYVGALREYYSEEFRNGDSDESFLLWIQQKLGIE